MRFVNNVLVICIIFFCRCFRSGKWKQTHKNEWWRPSITIFNFKRVNKTPTWSQRNWMGCENLNFYYGSLFSLSLFPITRLLYNCNDNYLYHRSHKSHKSKWRRHKMELATISNVMFVIKISLIITHTHISFAHDAVHMHWISGAVNGFPVSLLMRCQNLCIF